MKQVFIFLFCLLLGINLHAATPAEVVRAVDEGHWQAAQAAITAALQQTNLDFQTRQDLLFQRDRMQRLRWEFHQTRDEVFQLAQTLLPSLTAEQFARWEAAGAVESMNVDGTNWYFNRAAKNIFLLNPEAKALKQKVHPVVDEQSLRLANARQIIATEAQTGAFYNSPRTCRVTYSVSVPAGTVPPGETLRAWLPFPMASNRQKNIKLVATEPPTFISSLTNALLTSKYLEQPAATNAPTIFKIVFDYTSDAFYQPIDPALVQPAAADDPAPTSFMGEKPPQIVFTDEIKNLSATIVGDETNSYRKAQKIFAWVSHNITWTGAREYSTVMCLPRQALTLRHGDCGMKTLTFMTLCRYNGIPARWESGWVTDDGNPDMHDWCRIYLAPYGWVPVDVTYGLLDSPDEHEKWFYLGGIDAERLVLNSDNNQPLYPAKTFFRSEIVDFQRGEVEWRGGNLYFSQWQWSFDAPKLSAN
jgi:transglutaminase-like putative cysteine protease